MKGKKEKVAELIEQINRQKKSLELLTLLIEQEENDAAITLTEKAEKGLRRIISDLEDIENFKELNASTPQNDTTSQPTQVNPMEQWLENALKWVWVFLSSPRYAATVIVRHSLKILVVVLLLASFFGGKHAYQKFYLARHGLMGEYYSDRDLRDLFSKRKDFSINFRWLHRPPLPRFKAENFSVRWTGFVKAEKEGDYQFSTYVDDGCRLWVDDTQLVEAKIRLSPGFHKIKLEYFQGEGDTVVKLFWKRPGDSSKSIIKPIYLYPSEEATEGI
jgi:PA14 domain